MPGAAPESPLPPRRRLIAIIEGIEGWLKAEKENGAVAIQATPALVRTLSAPLPPARKKPAAPVYPLEPEVAFISTEAPAGDGDQLLTLMIQAMGYDRSQVAVLPVVPNLAAHIRRCRPRLLVPLGPDALAALPGAPPFERENWFKWEQWDTLPTHAPGRLVKEPVLKHEAWKDLQAVLARLGRKAPDRKKK